MDEHLERQYLEVELYEKIVVRERRRKTILIALSSVLFLFLCGIPVYQERFPKWESLEAARKIAVEVGALKTESIHLKKPLLLTIMDKGVMKIEQVSHCSASPEDKPQKVEEVLYQREWTDSVEGISFLNEEEAKKFQLGFAVHKICFDPVAGVSLPKTKKVIVLVPVKDLAESRLDRASYVEIETSSAKVSVN